MQRAQVRKPKGTGSVYAVYIEGVFTLWRGYVPVGRKPGKNGKMVPDKRWATSATPGGRGKAEVEQALTDIKAAAEEERGRAGQAVPGCTLWESIEAWAAWVPNSGEGTSEGVARTRLGQARKWVAPHTAGSLPLTDLDLDAVMRLFEDIAPSLGADSLQDILSVIRRSLNYAIRRHKETGFTGPNIADNVKMTRPGHARRPWDVLTRNQAEEILAATSGTRMRALMMTGFLLGLRPGELRALKWGNIDFRAGLLDVVEYARETGDGHVKTELSRRALRVPARLLRTLLAHRVIWEAEREDAGTAWPAGEAGDYVFCTPHGQQLDKDRLRRAVTAVFSAAGHPFEDAYVMRHTFCSIAYDMGVPNRDIARLMGHANESVFLRVYAHNLRPRAEVDGRHLDDIWGAADPSQLAIAA